MEEIALKRKENRARDGDELIFKRKENCSPHSVKACFIYWHTGLLCLLIDRVVYCVPLYKEIFWQSRIPDYSQGVMSELRKERVSLLRLER